MVTITDPRHPLYDQTFPLVHIKNRQNLVRCCLVRIAPGVERLIPVAVTDLSMLPPLRFPLPLALSSLHNLTQVFARLQEQGEKECGDARNANNPATPETGPAPADLAYADAGAAPGYPAPPTADLSDGRRPMAQGAEQ